ncbi:g758 [Coccomyxa viridis]|uniref:G758 protein n=1 Tax=Coccomyxa viridis TaxID=1274662 RepID=A0ABP1FGH2_9CHLO
MPNLEKSTSLVVFVSPEGEEGVRLTYVSASLKTLADSIRESKGWPDRGLRFILAGRELYEDDIVEAAQAPVLHCMVVDESVQGSVRRQHRPPPNAEPVDWMDALDPGKFIMWLMAGVLASCWLILLVKSDLLDRPSVIMLCVMTAIFAAPLLWTSALWAAAMLWPACAAQAPSDLQQRRL